MEASKTITSLIPAFTVLVLDAVPNDDAPTTTLVPVQITDSSSSAVSDDVEEEASPEGEMEKLIAELKEKQCLVLLGDCWLLHKSTKSKLPKEQRLRICLKKMQGFVMCEFMNDASVQKAKEEAEIRQKAREEEILEKEKGELTVPVRNAKAITLAPETTETPKSFENME